MPTLRCFHAQQEYAEQCPNASQSRGKVLLHWDKSPALYLSKKTGRIHDLAYSYSMELLSPPLGRNSI